MTAPWFKKDDKDVKEETYWEFPQCVCVCVCVSCVFWEVEVMSPEETPEEVAVRMVDMSLELAGHMEYHPLGQQPTHPIWLCGLLPYPWYLHGVNSRYYAIGYAYRALAAMRWRTLLPRAACTSSPPPGRRPR